MNRNCKAFSLIEIVISLVVLAITLLGFSANFSIMEKGNTLAQRRFQAVDFARETMEDLFSPARDYATDTDLSAGQHTSDSATLTLSLPAGCDLTRYGASRSYGISDYSENSTLIGKKIVVTVSWTENGQLYQEQLSSLVVPR